MTMPKWQNSNNWAVNLRSLNDFCHYPAEIQMIDRLIMENCYSDLPRKLSTD